MDTSPYPFWFPFESSCTPSPWFNVPCRKQIQGSVYVAEKPAAMATAAVGHQKPVACRSIDLPLASLKPSEGAMFGQKSEPQAPFDWGNSVIPYFKGRPGISAPLNFPHRVLP